MAACELYYRFARVFDIASPPPRVVIQFVLFAINAESCAHCSFSFPSARSKPVFHRPAGPPFFHLLTCRRYIRVALHPLGERNWIGAISAFRGVIGMQMIPRRILISADCYSEDIIILIAANCGFAAGKYHYLVAAHGRINRALKKINNSVGNL